jgi:hypothetical protein
VKRKLSLSDLAKPLRRYLQGGLDRTGLSREAARLHQELTSGAAAVESGTGASGSVAATALGLIAILLDSGRPPTAPRLEGLLACVAEKLERTELDGLRRFLPRVFGELRTLRLRALENPLGESFAGGFRKEWIDVGLLQARPTSRWLPAFLARADVRLIPFSVFTRRFFHEELPRFFLDGAASGLQGTDIESRACLTRADRFYYHPENDQAIALAERFPRRFARRPRFQYFVDEAGFAEIVLDTTALGLRDLVFSAQLFCLQTGARRATLDGWQVAGIRERRS